MNNPKHFYHILPFIQPADVHHTIPLTAQEVVRMHTRDDVPVNSKRKRGATCSTTSIFAPLYRATCSTTSISQTKQMRFGIDAICYTMISSLPADTFTRSIKRSAKTGEAYRFKARMMSIACMMSIVHHHLACLAGHRLELVHVLLPVFVLHLLHHLLPVLPAYVTKRGSLYFSKAPPEGIVSVDNVYIYIHHYRGRAK